MNLRTDNDCDLPNPPSYPGEYIEAVLDYYLKYEKYKNDFNAQIYDVATNPTGCRGFDSASGTPNYTDEWDTYENSVENFKIKKIRASSNSVRREIETKEIF